MIELTYINQEGYISPFLDDNDPDAGLWIANEDGTPSSVRNKFVVEREVELRFALYPGLDPSQQSLKGVLWAFYGKVLYYMKEDRFISGKFMTVNLVYNDVQRVDNEPVGFGKVPDSYRPMYDGRWSGSLPLAPYSGQTSGSPYYHPPMGYNMYHPIYRTSAVRYCHEKNRDVNGDGIIDDSEADWYLPSLFEVDLMWIAGVKEINNLPDGQYEGQYALTTEYTFGTNHHQNGQHVYSRNLQVGETSSSGREREFFIPRCVRAL